MRLLIALVAGVAVSCSLAGCAPDIAHSGDATVVSVVNYGGSSQTITLSVTAPRSFSGVVLEELSDNSGVFYHGLTVGETVPVAFDCAGNPRLVGNCNVDAIGAPNGHWDRDEGY